MAKGTKQATIPDALVAATQILYKEGCQRIKNAHKQARDADRRERQLGKRIPKVDACFKVMEEAYAYSTGDEALPTSARDLYYAVRNRIERFGYDADELAYPYFSQAVLTRYRHEVRELPKVFYDPRGILYEPHGGRAVNLGTKSVAEYDFPDHVFDKVLYVEKKGRGEVLRAAGFGEKYDMTIVGGEGYATEAIRDLFTNAEEGDYQLFVLHDADPAGYNIARTLREETARMPGYSVDVIDIGLGLEEALAMRKRPETYTRKRELPVSVEAALTEIEREYFTGEEHVDKNGKKYWIAKRVELNDLSSPELVEYVEHKLGVMGVRDKVIPPINKLPELSNEMYREQTAGFVKKIVYELVIIDEVVAEITDEFIDEFELQQSRSYIEEGFRVDDTLSWRDALKDKLLDIQVEYSDALKEAVREKVVEAAKEV
jgi:hypothetical protein